GRRPDRIRVSLHTKPQEPAMNMNVKIAAADQYAQLVKTSKTAQWDIDTDVIKGRSFDASMKYLPDGLSFVDKMTTLSDAEKRFASQIQGRTYANMFGLVERFITAKLLEVGRDHAMGDQMALEAMVRFSEEELKHQALFRRIEDMMGKTQPA